MISERTLKKWRKEALVGINTKSWDEANQDWMIKMSQRILQMSQELLDQHLMRRN